MQSFELGYRVITALFFVLCFFGVGWLFATWTIHRAEKRRKNMLSDDLNEGVINIKSSKQPGLVIGNRFYSTDPDFAVIVKSQITEDQ